MNSFINNLTEEDVKAVTWYMKSLSDTFDKSLLPTKPPLLDGATTQPATQPTK